MNEVSPSLGSILQEFSAALRELYGDRFAGLWLYGSQARRDARPESDVDVLLVLREVSRPTREIDRIADVLVHFNLRYGVLFSVLPVDERTLQSSKGPFWRNVRRDGRRM